MLGYDSAVCWWFAHGLTHSIMSVMECGQTVQFIPKRELPVRLGKSKKLQTCDQDLVRFGSWLLLRFSGRSGLQLRSRISTKCVAEPESKSTEPGGSLGFGRLGAGTTLEARWEFLNLPLHVTERNMPFSRDTKNQQIRSRTNKPRLFYAVHAFSVGSDDESYVACILKRCKTDVDKTHHSLSPWACKRIDWFLQSNCYSKQRM